MNDASFQKHEWHINAYEVTTDVHCTINAHLQLNYDWQKNSIEQHKKCEKVFSLQLDEGGKLQCYYNVVLASLAFYCFLLSWWQIFVCINFLMRVIIISLMTKRDRVAYYMETHIFHTLVFCCSSRTSSPVKEENKIL